MPRPAVSVEERQQRRLQEQRLRREKERELRRMMASDEEEQDDPVRIVEYQPTRPANERQFLARETYTSFNSANLPSNIRLPVRPRPPIDGLRRQSGQIPQPLARTDEQTEPAESATATRESAADTTPIRSDKHLQRVYERIQRLEDLQTQHRRAREQGQQSRGGDDPIELKTTEAPGTSQRSNPVHGTIPAKQKTSISVQVPGPPRYSQLHRERTPAEGSLLPRSGSVANASSRASSISVSREPSTAPSEQRVSQSVTNLTDTGRPNPSPTSHTNTDTICIPSSSHGSSARSSFSQSQDGSSPPPEAFHDARTMAYHGSEPEAHRDSDRVRGSSIPELADLHLADEGASRPMSAAGTDAFYAANDTPRSSDYMPSSKTSSPAGESARSISAFGPDSRPATPATSGFSLDDSPSGMTVSQMSLLSSPGISEVSDRPRSADQQTPTTARGGLGACPSVVSRYIRATLEQETRGGPDFLAKQGKAYQEVLRTFFSLTCNCPHAHEQPEPEDSHTLSERAAHLQRHLPGLPQVFGESGSYEPRKYFNQWQKLLSDQPLQPLSLRKTQDLFLPSTLTISRWWDVDSVWIGAKTLAAIRAPNDFRITFLPRFSLNLSTDQVVQPHGLNLAKTRHVPLGSFHTGSVRFAVFVFFPSSASTPHSKTSATSNALSHERLRELYDEIILPALRETISSRHRQEVPQSFDMIYAKSNSFQEQPAIGQRSADDVSRSTQLSYTLPAKELWRFWSSVEDKARLFRVQTKRGEPAAYFENPRLLFQAHDLKNTFSRSSLHEVLTHFSETVLAALDPEHLDMRSCWLDIGARYCADGGRCQQRGGAEPTTFLWKSPCNRHAHEKLVEKAPDVTLGATYFRSFLLRDAGNLMSKTSPAKAQSAGHPDCRQVGVIRAKAYTSAKELFGVMYSSYGLCSSAQLSLLALSQDMIQDLDSLTKDRERVFTTRRSRETIVRAWEANKRHISAISDQRAVMNYGARKEATFCLGAILKEWSDGHFDPDQNPHTGRLVQAVPGGPESDEHCPFWIVPTKDLHALIFTQAARLMLPLDHLFQEATRTDADEDGGHCNTAESFVRRLFALYTAQLFSRLLVYNFTSEREFHFDKWIWYSSWKAEKEPGVFVERRGLGLDAVLDSSGMLWIPRDVVDWRRGHIALGRLIDLYIPRSPLQARLTSQKNIQGLTTTQLTVEYILQEWVEEAGRDFLAGQEEKGHELANRILRLSAEEIARTYNQHLLAKIQAYWDRVRSSIGRSALPALTRLQRAQANVAAERSRIVTAQTIWSIYEEAWAAYIAAVPDDDYMKMPLDLPCWMTTRKYRPPKDGWSEFVYYHLFNRSIRPKWNRIYFLQVYRTFKKFWNPIKAYAGRFDDGIKRALGHSILVAFNSNQAKEVSTNHTPGTWYHGKPTFFQIQYWAPYFSPPEENRSVRPPLKALKAPRVLTALQFQDYERVALQDWICVVDQADALRATGKETVNARCRRALRRMTLLAGPTWGDGDKLDHIVPWQLGSTDALRVPQLITAARAAPDTILSEPTIMLPTRDNVVTLFKAIKSFPGLSEGVKTRWKWAWRRLDNDGKQYDIRSHLEAKKEAAELTSQSPSLLRQFLAQAEPPERQLGEEELRDGDAESGLFVADESDTEVESDGVELLDDLPGDV